MKSSVDIEERKEGVVFNFQASLVASVTCPDNISSIYIERVFIYRFGDEKVRSAETPFSLVVVILKQIIQPTLSFYYCFF